MTDERLPSGMRVDEAVRRASDWWNRRGRYLMGRHVNTNKTRPRTKAGSKSFPAITIAGEERVVYPSGILNGEPWELLNKRERLQVVKQWHVQFIVMPDPELRPHIVHELQDQSRRLGLPDPTQERSP